MRARAQLKASLMMALESCFAQSEELARQLLVFGRRIPPDEIIAKVDAVDQAAIRRVGRRLLAERRPDARRDRPARQPPGPRHDPPPVAVRSGTEAYSQARRHDMIGGCAGLRSDGDERFLGYVCGGSVGNLRPVFWATRR